ncbi:MAG: hypothetical protein JSU92_13575 [Deltaproteobacteria bacterium]|nr:MAG: hypothetical protein JSU92_13575 [Deltaproteobacteria bacterium]
MGVRIGKNLYHARTISRFLLPGEETQIEIIPTNKGEEYQCSSSDGKLTEVSVNRYKWSAPEKPGLYPLTISQKRNNPKSSNPADPVRLHGFVLVPYDRLRKGVLNGYRIGKYPIRPYRGLPAYLPPKGFVEVTRENHTVLVSDHFRLQDFLCKQESSYPKYIVLSEASLMKLEMILEGINREGHRCSRLTIMSGYRTPHYNRMIGNVRYSRHIYGDGIDFFIDENPRDEVMDDLNRDGRVDIRDARLIYDIIKKMSDKHIFDTYPGGLGYYGSTSRHGPFVHIDARGYRVHWGGKK